MLPDGGKFVQLTLQDLPEVPSAANVEEKLDLPDVPTKAPVITEAVMEDTQDTSAGVSVQKKGYFFFLLYLTYTCTHIKPSFLINCCSEFSVQICTVVEEPIPA